MAIIRNIFENNNNIRVIERNDNIRIIEYIQDKSVGFHDAVYEYFASKMNSRKRQAIVELDNQGFIISAGAMQWTAGTIKCKSDVEGVGDLLGKVIKGSVTKESAIKPKYEGSGYLVLEPTYKYLILEDVGTWPEGIVLDDGLFLGCQATLKQSVVARDTFSSAALDNKGLFNLYLMGQGVAILESPVPREELVEIELEDDELRIDGNFAIAWSKNLRFTVQKSTKNLIGSAISGEGFVNVYQGTGKVLLSPVETSRIKNTVKSENMRIATLETR